MNNFFASLNLSEVKKNKKNIFLFGLLSLICLFPNLSYIYFGDSLSGNTTKKIAFLIISIICFIVPFLLFKIRTSFLINGIFVLFAPIEITEIYLNKQTVTPGTIVLILQTNVSEVFELLGSIKLFIFATLLIYFAYFICVNKLPRNVALFTGKNRLTVVLLCAIFLFSLYIYFFALGTKVVVKSKEVFMFANGSLTSKFEEIYPCDLLISINRGVKMYQSVNQTLTDVEHFSFGAEQEVKSTEKEIYLLVIGETARYANFSINNYSRITCPLLAKTNNLVSFSDVFSEANITQNSLPILLTRATAQNFELFKKEKSIIDAFNEAGFSTYWVGNQSAGNTFVQRVIKKTKEHFLVTSENGGSENLDENLWIYLDKILDEKDTKQFILIHTMGSHYRYDKRYPKAFKKFIPDSEGSFGLDLIDVRNKDKQINSYDNSILYTDYFLSNTIAKINRKSSISSLIYISDHGENLFENGRTLHGDNSPTIYEAHVPFFVWTSDKYNQFFPQKMKNIIENRNCSITSSVVFYSLLDIANIEIRENKKQKSISSNLLHADSTRFILNKNEQLYIFNNKGEVKVANEKF